MTQQDRGGKPCTSNVLICASGSGSRGRATVSPRVDVARRRSSSGVGSPAAGA
ncbi:hypothetical protein [Streptomyces sp. ActVer]|uniref:hypothetical protein n=1 Tax=Streptomyces sp. ActVer TaxID=3014558 RepID=UPI0022B4A8F7|nr:hypothetical protein [Streptomyces sp. ActVer]